MIRSNSNKSSLGRFRWKLSLQKSSVNVDTNFMSVSSRPFGVYLEKLYGEAIFNQFNTFYGCILAVQVYFSDLLTNTYEPFFY